MRKGPRNHSSPTSPGGQGAPSSGRATRASKPGTAWPKEPRRASGLLTLVLAGQADAAGLGHPEHGVVEFGISSAGPPPA